uniref:Uncharacterized protein n=1 Tax=Timema shepardi TaxID=629360 RepID=A0A7R9ANZ9_TIMSH|nr:unnamed protein product [Timema shepardi]
MTVCLLSSVYNEQPERDSLNDPNSCPEPLPTPDPSPASAAATGARSKTPRYSGKLGTGRTLLGILTSGRSSSTDMLEHTEPFVHLWILLSSLYGRLLVILMVAFCITEVMDNSVKLLSLQINLCRDRGLNPGPPAQKSDTLPLDHQVTPSLIMQRIAADIYCDHRAKTRQVKSSYRGLGLIHEFILHGHGQSQVYTPDPHLTEVSLRSLSQVESINTGVRWCQYSVKKSTSECAVVKGIFLMYLYVGSIAVIICIYIWVLIDSCASLHAQSEITSPAMNTTDVENGDPELGGLSFARFGSLKRAHISRARTSATSFYLRVGALAFGLGTLVFNGLEMAMHSMMEGACLNDVVFVHPILHGLFTFLQMHFLFVNSQSTPILGARVASNIPTPLQLRGFPRSMLTRHQRDLTFSRNITSAHIYQPLSDNHISQVVSLHECLNTNSLGQLWTSSMPFLYTFIIQFSRSPSTRKRLHTVMEEMVLPVLELIQFVDTRWSSEYNMLSRLHAVRKAVGAELANSENNIEILTEVEWKQAAGIVEVLGPLADATKEINKALKSRFSFYDSDPIFCPSMLCDPRFRGVLIDDMVAVNTLAIEVKKLSDKSSLEPNVKDEHPSCSSSSSGLWSSFDSIPNTTQPAIDNNSEVKDYLNEPRVPISGGGKRVLENTLMSPSLIAAAVTFIMGQNVGLGRIYMNKHKKLNNNNNINCGGSSKGCSMTERMMEDNWSVDCGGASKGLFLGLLCLVAGIVVIIIFLVVKEDLDFPVDTIFWLTSGALAAILSLSCFMTVVGLVQIRRLSYSGKEPSTLDSLLATVTATGVQLYSVFGIVVGASGLAVADIEGSHAKNTMLLSVSFLQLIQACGQSTLISEGMRRASLTRYQMIVRPGRQIITFLLCSNAVLWAYDTFVTQSWMSQELQLRFFGVLAWGIVSRIGLPLLVFYRFHSCVLLLEVWKRSYRTPLLDPGN